VLTVVKHHEDFNLYTFSSAKPSWSMPRRCFNKTRLDGKDGFMMVLWNGGVVCRGTTHWLAAYMSSDIKSTTYHTFNVNIQTGHISSTEISIPADKLSRRDYGWPMLNVAVDGALNLFYVHDKDGLPRLDMWTRQGDGVRETVTFWHHIGKFDLKPLKQYEVQNRIRVWSAEKSGPLFILYYAYESSWRVHRLDLETGEMEEVTGSFSDGAVPMEIDWPAFFMSRLGVHLC
jgi:hypothetical protein